VKLYPPKSTFSEDYIMVPRGCCAPKFLHVLENDQVLLVHPPQGTSVPLYNFFQRGFKIGLKFSISAPITLAVVEVAPRYFAT